MNMVLRLILGAPGLLFVLMGATWLIAPEQGASQLGMTLLDGVGLTSQIADIASFFLTLGLTILIGAATGHRVWFFPAVMLLGIAAAGRVIAFAVHGGALTTEMIAVEVVIASLLFFGSARLKPKDA